MSVQSFQILRKLGGSEKFFVNAMDKHCNFINSRCFLVESKIDLYANIGLLQRSLIHWQNKHHFLRSCVTRKEDGDLYFAYAPKSNMDSPENVKILTYNPCGSNDSDFWQHIFKKEFNLKLDRLDSLLWRLKFIRSGNVANGSFSYHLIFTANHAIIDGRNAFCIIHQLVNIIEKTYLSRELNIEPYEVLPAHHQHDYVQKHGKKKSADSVAPIQLPDSFKYDESKATQTPCDSRGTFFDMNNKFYASNAEIISDNRKGFTEIFYLRFDAEKIAKLRNLCKQNGCKLTGCMNLIILIANQQMLFKYSTSPANPILHGYSVDNRQLIVPPVDPLRMGYCSVVFGRHFEEFLQTEDADFWAWNFWKFVKRESDLIHERLKNGESMDIALNDETVDYSDIPRNSSLFHFIVANRGDTTKYSDTEFKKLKIKEHFNSMSFGKESGPALFFFSLDSIENNLCMSFSYNNRIVGRDAVDFVGSVIKDTVNRLVGSI
jgi:hypothetical protein